MPRTSQRVKACRALQLSDRFEPTVRIQHLLKIPLDEVVACLRTSTEETAQVICAFYDRLGDLNDAIDIDYLIAAAHCKDIFKVFGLICESYAKAKAMETQMIASMESPAIMKSRTRYARERNGFQDAKMILQATGTVPVPRNQVNYMIGNRVENNQQVNVNIPSHLDVASTVNEVMVELSPPENVPSSDNRGEEESSREEDQEDSD